MKEFWDDRYENTEYAYGEEPNVYFKNQLNKLPPGTILLPGDGEGRNGVFASTTGWHTTSFDISTEGKNKAELLASKKGVNIEYLIGSWEDIIFPKESFDSIALIYAHFQSDKKQQFYEYIDSLLKPKGIIIFEAFSKNHLLKNKHNSNVGGPKELDMLFSKDEVLSYFKGYEIIELKQTEVKLQEGEYHNGTGSVIRFVGKK